MSRKGKQSVAEAMQVSGNVYKMHYERYLKSLVLQMFKWHNLPPGINERFLEMALHTQGQVCIFKNKLGDFVAATGSQSGLLDIYGEPTNFQPVFQNGSYAKTVKLLQYDDDIATDKNCGVLIFNDDFKAPTTNVIDLFAEEMAHIKMVTRININNQKTPYLIKTTDDKLHSTLKAMNQINAYTDQVILNTKMDEPLDVSMTPAPYVADKLAVHLGTVWNEFMSFLGISNANTQKRERLISDEVNANNEQGDASENAFLKNRQEAANRLNRVFGLEIEVEMRTDWTARVKMMRNLLSEKAITDGGDDDEME